MTHMGLLLSLLLLLNGCASPRNKSQAKHIPAKDSHHRLVELDHQYFKIGYDPDLRLALYVSYQLSAENLSGIKYKRKNKFRADPLLLKLGVPYVEAKEYSRSGYDRGHLAPAADFAWSEEASHRTFVMSNMAPQKPKLNRKAWKMLEDQVRRWACGEKKITVITGPILEESRKRLKSGLLIPESFYKVIIDETPPKKILSFIYHQDDATEVLKKRMVSWNHLQMKSQHLSQFISAEIHSARRPASLKDWKEADCSK